MDYTSLSFNYATRKYELWGVDANGNAGIMEEQLELPLPAPTPPDPGDPSPLPQLEG